MWVVTIKGFDSSNKLTMLMKLKLDDRNLGYKIGELAHNYWISEMELKISEELD